MMNQRDINFIVKRLSDPVGNVSEAHHKLKALGYDDDAAVLMEAMQVFIDKCRPIRYKFEYGNERQP